MTRGSKPFTLLTQCDSLHLLNRVRGELVLKKRNRKDTGPKEDLTGMRFGKLTVVELAGKQKYPSGSTKYLWRCVCDCGNECTPTGNALKRANTTSCRKCIFEDLSYRKFGKLTALSRAGDTRNSAGKLIVMWNCICECGNNHIVASGNLKHGNVKSCGCLFEDNLELDLNLRKHALIDKFKSVHGDRFSYDISNFENFSSRVKIFCDQHGEFTQRVSDHISGTSCPSCSYESKSIGQAEFLRRSSLAHGDKYDYSAVDFKTTSGRVKIICPEHGLFEQIAKSHMDGHECFECSLMDKHWAYKARCENNPDFANKAGNLYLFRLTVEDEAFLKVGVSVNLPNRIAHYRKENIKVEPLSVIDLTAKQSADEEVKLLKFIRDNKYKYTPKFKFAGWTECVDEQYEDTLISYFDRLEENYFNVEV